MNKFIEQMMELGAMEDRACSKTERNLLIKEAEELYDKHLGELKLLGIANVRLSFVDWVSENYPTLKNHGDNLTLSELRTAYNQYINEA